MADSTDGPPGQVGPIVAVPIEAWEQLLRTASHLRSIAEQLIYIASVLENTVARVQEQQR